MNEAIALLIFGAMLIILLLTFSYAQVSLASLSAKLSKRVSLERERSREDLKAAWAGSYHVILSNDGSRDVMLSDIYVYVNESRIPIYRGDLNNELLKAGSYKMISLQRFGAKPDLDKGYARLFSTDPSTYFIDRHFLSGDELDFGPNGYSLHRGPGSGDLTASLNLGRSRRWSLCSWIKVEPEASRDQVIVEAKVRSGENIELYFSATRSKIEAAIGWVVLSPDGIDPASWNHYCIIIEEHMPFLYKASLYVNGALKNSTYIFIPQYWPIKVESIMLGDPGIDYWVDNLFIAPVALSNSQVRLLAANGKPPMKYVEFPFDYLVNNITRIDVVTDLGIIHNFTRIIKGFPSPSMSGECRLIGTNPLSLDCGNVAPTSYIPLEIPGNHAGFYFLQYNRWIRYWNITSYVTGVQLIYDPHRDVTTVNMSGGRGIQLISTLDLVNNWRDVEAMLGNNITFSLINVRDGNKIKVKVRVESLSLIDLEMTDDEVRGKVIWANGDPYIPRGDWEYIDIVVLETGDSAVIKQDGSFQVNLSSSKPQVTLMIFLPDYGLPIFQGYMVPFSGTYVVERGGG